MANGAPSARIVILGAGRAQRGHLPTAMRPTGRHGRVIDWIMGAFTAVMNASICFVGGYRAEAIRHEYPDIELVVNPNWRVTGPAASLSYARISADAPAWVSYADVVFREATVRAMAAIEDADFVIAIDRMWSRRYDRRAPREMSLAEKVVCDASGVVQDIGSHILSQSADGEFCGLVKLQPRAVAAVKEIFAGGRLPATASIPALVRELLARGLSGRVYDTAGDWAELNAPQDLAQFVLGTKAESLERLKPLLRSGQIGELISFPMEDWTARRDAVVADVRAKFPDTTVIVRSSAMNEDGWHESAAGAFTSVVDVDSADPAAIARAVDEVFASYGAPQPKNHVLVQEQLRAVAVSGVVMTRTPTLGAPYYVINFDSSTRRTDTVTSGEGTEVRTVYLHREAPLTARLQPELGAVVTVVKELEGLVGHDSLDIEFAVDDDGTVHVLQVRPIAGQHKHIPVDDVALQGSLRRGMEFFEQLQTKPSPFLVGKTTQLSVMSDWNPAEIIGVKPKRLAFSLYRHCITDAVWAAQRADNGYRDVRPCNLLVDVLGHPYVDVRATFNSFVPARVPDELAGRLLDHYLGVLRDAPALHDKVEFDILFTCLAFDFEDRSARLREAGFSGEDIEQLRAGLREVTACSVRTTRRDLEAVEHLKRRQEVLLKAPLPPLDRAFLLIEDVRRHGTIVFANLARSGFVAVSMLRSLDAVGVTTRDQTEQFLRSVRTVSGELQKDARAVKAGAMTWEAFVAEYGHLRPGTYDICSPNYAAAAEEFLRPLLTMDAPAHEPAAEIWDADTRSRIAEQLAGLGLGLDEEFGVDAFAAFLRAAIEGREFAKFVFTRNLSAALEALAEFGARYSLTRDDLAHVAIDDLFRLRGAPSLDIGEALRQKAQDGREAFNRSQALCLPGHIVETSDFLCFEQSRARANFVTRKKVQAPLVHVDGVTSAKLSLAGKVVLISHADPGYDWLFGREIGGLITMYGGVNSHMAIRAAEFGLPAAIGVGEVVYQELRGVEVVILDCESQKIRPVGAAV